MDVKRAGRDVTVIVTQTMVIRALQAAGDLELGGPAPHEPQVNSELAELRLTFH